MPNTVKTVELAEDLQSFAEERVRAGLSASVGDVVREAVEEKKLAVLREALDVGLAQAGAGQVISGTPAEHMDRIRKRHGMSRTP